MKCSLNIILLNFKNHIIFIILSLDCQLSLDIKTDYESDSAKFSNFSMEIDGTF